MEHLPVTALKPVEQVQIISNALLPFCKKHWFESNKKIKFSYRNAPVCYLLLEGTVTIRRGKDSLVVSNAYAPTVLGLTNLLTPVDKDYYLRVESRATIAVIVANSARRIISEMQLWENVSALMSYMICRQASHSSRMIVKNNYEMVYANVLKLMREPQEFREGTTVAKYIQDRTLLSRSGIMRALAELKNKKIIVMNDGYLISA
ncbi:helix-turn-helix domain-containing protein [Lelliottia sp.]|uniref:helix-turn-helix domain-containing protein n=1 Tax=Lelliottia sp. TaxID=1898429 RepID=UPI00388EEF95